MNNYFLCLLSEPTTGSPTTTFRSDDSINVFH